MAAAAATTRTADPTAAVPPEADPANEVFDLVDDTGAIIGQESRSVCHKLGLLHRAVYVFVFDDRGRLLIQRRSDAKKIGPGQWDLSVAEHLSQGETFHQAATRGLQEELGIAAAVLQQPLGPMHKRSLLIPGRYADNELVQSYRVDGWRGQVQWNPAEVSEVAFRELTDLRQQMAAEPEMFTQWFREEVQLLGWFGVGAHVLS